MSGIHLPSHAVTRIVLSAVKVLTVVFGMGTGVSPSRIDTGQILTSFEANVGYLTIGKSQCQQLFKRLKNRQIDSQIETQPLLFS